MKKLLLILLFVFCIAFVYAECSYFEALGLNKNNTYSLNGINHTVYIKEAGLNSFDVTIDGITYSSVYYNSSFETDNSEKAYLGKPYAASSVMYTSIDFCMEETAEIDKAETADKHSSYLYYLLGGIIIVVFLVIFYLFFKKK